ncbi:MAG: TolC family protein, partial [Acidobacteriota bacterium]
MTIRARTQTLLLALLLCGSTYAAAQTTSGMGGYTAGQGGMQSAPAAASASIQAAQGQNPFLGGAPPGPAQPGVLQLSLTDAIQRGLKYNLGLLLSDQATAQARGAKIRALSRLLPQISAGTSGTSQQINLKALGFPSTPGIPSIIGPFSVFDVRGYLDQPVLNLEDLHQEKAEAENVKAAQYTYQNARD